MTELLRVRDLVKHYPLPRQHLFKPPGVVQALRGVSFEVQTGRSFGIVGESGSGKSTLARQVMALETPTSGSVELLRHNLHTLSAIKLREIRQHIQMVFQDPYGSLDPHQTVATLVAEPLSVLPTDRSNARSDTRSKGQSIDLRERAADALQAVGLRASDLDKYPHEFSGGQRQRIAIARALITRPQLIVADEPVSALDVSVQAQVLNLMMDLQDQFGVTYLLISHDLAVVQHVCDEVIVMQNGQIVERGPPQRLFSQPEHPYTQALVAAVPRM
jgi:ABC-type oligopeptide transport system ATPase subunit